MDQLPIVLESRSAGASRSLLNQFQKCCNTRSRPVYVYVHGEDGSTFLGSSSPMNQSSTRWRAHGVLRRNVRLDLTVGLNWKQRMGMRRPISPQPCRWASWLRICSSVTPCNGSRGWKAGEGISLRGEDLVEGGVEEAGGGGLGGGDAMREFDTRF